MAAKLCDSCESATATLFCRADSAFLCLTCDSKVHAANKLASRHARVWVCEVCEHAPAAVTCKADAAHLCVTCDRDIHSANPLARRHDRVPLAPFFELTDSPTSSTDKSSPSAATDDTEAAEATAASVKANAINKLFGEEYYSDLEAEEAEAASWLVSSNPNPSKEGGDQNKAVHYLFADDDIDPYLDLDFSADPKAAVDDDEDEVSNGGADCVVPEQKVNHHHQAPQQQHHQAVFSFPSRSNHFVDGFGGSAPCKPFSFSYNAPAQLSLNQSISSSSLEVGVVPDASATPDISTGGIEKQTMKSNDGGIDREARVLRYREKRKNRKFEKTIRYASRKAYAETRPRIKGRFAKRTDAGTAVEVVDSLFASPHQPLMQDPGYGVVPSY